MTNTETQIIDTRVTASGVEYTRVLTITETSVPPKDISAASIDLCLGTENEVGVWRTPEIDTASADSDGERADVQNQRNVAMLIGGSYKPASGDYLLYSRVGDAPEAIVRKHFAVRIRADA